MLALERYRVNRKPFTWECFQKSSDILGQMTVFSFGLVGTLVSYFSLEIKNFTLLILVVFTWSGRLVQAASWYGLVVHMRIYPIIYSLPIILVLDPLFFQYTKPALVNWSARKSKSQQTFSCEKLMDGCCMCNFLTSLFTWRRIMFGLISGALFFLLTWFFFFLYGWDFLHEALLYHLTRTDPRHNFSIYFYHIYLHYEHELSNLEKLVSFLPQIMVQLVLVFRFAQDFPFCFFVQTLAFVAFNKVCQQCLNLFYFFCCCWESANSSLIFLQQDNVLFLWQVMTAQYFVWFFCLLPLILPWTNMKLKGKGLVCILAWMAAQGHWLLWGYLLEFKGKNVFLQLWVASLLFLAANTFVLINIIRQHTYSPVFQQSPRAASKKHVKQRWGIKSYTF